MRGGNRYWRDWRLARAGEALSENVDKSEAIEKIQMLVQARVKAASEMANALGLNPEEVRLAVLNNEWKRLRRLYCRSALI